MKYYRPKMELTGKRLSANTIASFMAAQSADDPDQIRADLDMSADLLRFLLRSRAISYWRENDWLAMRSSNQHLALTTKGSRKIQDRLAGRAKAQSVTREAVLDELRVILGVTRAEPLVELELPDNGGPEASAPPGVNNRLTVDERTLAAIWARRGQRDFRASLLDAYQSRCAISRCEVVDALEAAHITPYSEDQAYGTSNGILLRSDIHTLFDLFLLSVDPASWTVRIAPQLASSYGEIDGIKLSLPAEITAHPNHDRLLRHYKEWHERWGGIPR
jgi:hypothetical protein